MNMRMTVFYDHVREACRQSNMSLREVAQLLKEQGIIGVEMDYYEMTEELVCELNAAGIPIHNVYCHFDWSGTPADESNNSLWLKVLGDLRKYGIGYMLVIPGFVKEGGDYEAQRKSMAKGCRLLCDEAEELGIKVCMEDFDDSAAPYSTYEGVRWFLDEVPKLSCAFDTGNFYYSGQDVMEAYEALKDRIGYVHCKDRSLDAKPGETPKACVDGQMMYSASVGSGIIPMREIVRAIINSGYQGVWAIEHFGSQNQLEDILASAEFLNAIKAECQG